MKATDKTEERSPAVLSTAGLGGIVFHDGCNDSGCARCRAANEALEGMLYGALGDRMDWLGRYHGWLGKQGISPETDGGWWSREALNDGNVGRFIGVYLEAA